MQWQWDNGRWTTVALTSGWVSCDSMALDATYLAICRVQNYCSLPCSIVAIIRSAVGVDMTATWFIESPAYCAYCAYLPIRWLLSLMIWSSYNIITPQLSRSPSSLLSLLLLILLICLSSYLSIHPTIIIITNNNIDIVSYFIGHILPIPDCHHYLSSPALTACPATLLTLYFVYFILYNSYSCIVVIL